MGTSIVLQTQAAQNTGLTRTMVGRGDVSVPGRGAVVARVEVAGVIHDAHNNGTVPVKLVGVYVVEKGKPLATPAP